MKTLATAYADHQTLARQLLDRIEKALDTHAAAAAAKPAHWGYVGDMNVGVGKLIEALGAFGALTDDERARYRV